MKTGSSALVLAGALLLAGAAHAQPAAAPPSAFAPTAAAPSDVPPAAATPPPPAAPAPAAGPTVSSLTVEGSRVPKKSCSSRDKDCIAIVVADLKAHYPEQLKTFCFQWKTQAIRSEWVNDQLMESLGRNAPPPPPAFGVNSAVSKACAPDKPAEKK
jgi:hypothetical protein